MTGYLLDTQTITYWFDAEDSRFPQVRASAERRGNDNPDAPLYVSAITLGEIEFGHRNNIAGAGAKREEFLRFVRKELPQVLQVSRHTAEPYGILRSALAEKFPPQGGWTEKKRAEQLYDPIAGREFGFDENDIWLTAQAVERNIVLVTNDKKFVRRSQDVALEVAEVLGARSFDIEN